VARENGRVSEDPAGFRIADGEAMHRAHPRSFFIPARAERESLLAGDPAKLLFEVTGPQDSMSRGERMWVRVTGRDADGYAGVLDNVPSVLTAIKLGDTVRFGPQHVIATSVAGTRPLLDKKMLVSRRSHEDDVRPGRVYREEPDNDRDSGWRALVGDETADEIDDPANILVQLAGFLLARWPELEPVLETDPDNGDWSWDEPSQRYVREPADASGAAS
jgi:hypothetical protein